MTDIPKARDILKAVLELDLSDEARDGVKKALSLMTRSYIKPRSRLEAQPITQKVVSDVLAYYRRNPKASCKQIGNIFDINGGRVSEIIAGKYKL